MTKPSTEQLKETLQQLIKQHNEAVQVQQNCKERIIATQAVIPVSYTHLRAHET